MHYRLQQSSRTQHGSARKPERVRAADPTTAIVWKRCIACATYFEGDWNGEYCCECCRTSSRPGQKVLALVVDEMMALPRPMWRAQ